MTTSFSNLQSLDLLPSFYISTLPVTGRAIAELSSRGLKVELKATTAEKAWVSLVFHVPYL